MVNRQTAIKLSKDFITECRQQGLRFREVWLFGSFATGEHHEWSDIDLLLVSDQFTNNVFDNLKLYSKINIRYPRIETHPYPTTSFLAGDSFIEEIKKSRIEIS